MATYDDFDGVWFTIQSIGMYQPEVLADVSFLVIDNHPEGPAASSLQALEAWLPHYRYVPFDGYRGTAVRDMVFREARADIVCCVDSHVLLQPGALAHLLEWFSAHPESRDLLQGPLLYDSLQPGATHLEPTWGAGMYGQWGNDPRLEDPDCAPFEIRMQGLGLFACRKDAWPGLNPRMRGFGGEEGYLHEKFRQRGGRVICHPKLGWLHRFSRPSGTSYPNIWEDRLRNYYIAWSEIGWDLAPVRSHFRELLGADVDVDALWERASAEAGHPLNAFDGVFCVAGGSCDSHSHPAGISWRTERTAPGQELGPRGPETRRLAGWREAVSRSSRRGYDHLLLLDGAEASGGMIVPSLPDQEWDLCLLAAEETDDGEPGPPPDPRATGSLAGLAVAVHERAYKRLLADLPADEAGQADFLATRGSLDRYLIQNIADGTFTAIQPYLAGPDEEQPRLAAGIEMAELPEGLIVRQAQPPRVHQLNNTASVILALCDGQRSVAGIAGVLAETFRLADLPVAEVTACVAELRRTGVLADIPHYQTKIRVLSAESAASDDPFASTASRHPKAGTDE